MSTFRGMLRYGSYEHGSTGLRVGTGMACSEMTLDAGLALELFLKELRPRALRLAWMELRESAAADDVVQDAMIRLVQSYSQRPPEEWTPLFYRILRNRITDWRRRRRVESIVSFFAGVGDDDEDAAVVDYPDPGPTPEAQMEGQQTGKRIQWALGQLPQRQREAFLLREWEGLSVAETAAAMSVTDGSVKTHHFRALSRLRELLREDGPVEDA